MVKYKLNEISMDMRENLASASVNERIIQRLMDGQVLEAIDEDNRSFCFDKDAGWVFKEWLVKVNSPIDVVESESKMF